MPNCFLALTVPVCECAYNVQCCNKACVTLSGQITIQDVTMETFMAFLEYLYTDHSPIEDGDSFGILVVANQYCVPRLLALCELYISKQVERAVQKSIKDAEIDIIGWCASHVHIMHVCVCACVCGYCA